MVWGGRSCPGAILSRGVGGPGSGGVRVCMGFGGVILSEGACIRGQFVPKPRKFSMILVGTGG